MRWGVDMAAGNRSAAVANFNLLSRVDGPQAVYALKVSLAVTLTLAVAFLFDLQNTYWALMTIPLIVRPQAGTMVWRGAARLTGTLLGALVGVFLVGSFGQSVGTILAAISLWLFATGCLARRESGTDAYAYAVAGTTTLVIAIDAGPDVASVYGYALARTTETAIAIVCSFLTLLVVFPVSMDLQVAVKLEEAKAGILSLSRRAAAGSGKPDPGAGRTAIVGLLSVNTDLRAQSFERSRRGWRLPRLTAVAVALNRLMAASDALAFALQGLEAGTDKVVREARARLSILLETPAASKDTDALMQVAGKVDDYMRSLDEVAASSGIHGKSEEGVEDRIGQVAVLYRLGTLAEALRGLMIAEADLLDPERPVGRVRALGGRFKDGTAILQSGIRPVITFLAAAGAWLSTGWSAGGTFTLLAGTLTMVLPTIVPRSALPAAGVMTGLGYVAGAVAALALMIVLPSLDGFVEFALVLGATIFVVFYMTGGAKTLAIGIGAILMLAIGLQPANEQTFSFIRFVNVAAVLALTTAAFIASVCVLFPENPNWLKRHLKKGLEKLLRGACAESPMREDAFLAQAVDILGDYGGDLSPTDPEAASLLVRGSAVIVAGLECYELRRLAVRDDLPLSLSVMVPALVSMVRASAGVGRSSRTAAKVRGMVREAILDVLDRGEASAGISKTVLRFAAISELLYALAASGDLAPPSGSPTDRTLQTWKGL
jgi:uncharacterized membrane protein YccC